MRLEMMHLEPFALVSFVWNENAFLFRREQAPALQFFMHEVHFMCEAHFNHRR